MAPFGARALDELGHARDGRGAEDEIDVGRALLHGRLLQLRHAAHDPHEQPGLARLQRPQLAELGEHLVLGLLADRTGVDEDEIGVRLAVGELVAMLAKQAGDPLGVVLVHLTAVGNHV